MNESLRQRQHSFWKEGQERFDIVIVGGGIQGAMTFHTLRELDAKVLLLEQGDFGSGTSQGSALSLWGGLLYLRQKEFREVVRLCRARDAMKEMFNHCVTSRSFRYIYPMDATARSQWLLKAGLWMYWFLGKGRQEIPRQDPFSSHDSFLKSIQTSFLYEEAQLTTSDARFVVDLIIDAIHENSLAMNYSKVIGGKFSKATHTWDLEVRNILTGQTTCVNTHWLINTCGIWSDALNESLSLISPYTHLESKGVSLNFARFPNHNETLIFDSPVASEEGMTLVPWGPVSVWGSTETISKRQDTAFLALAEDIQYLLKTINQHLKVPLAPKDIVSLRTGVRPIPVRKNAEVNRDPLFLSKKWFIHSHEGKRAYSAYGGKITSSLLLAESFLKIFANIFGMRKIPFVKQTASPPTIDLLGFAVVDPSWSKEHEAVYTLEDYLRRRTNIAQWNYNGGFGEDDTHAAILKDVCERLHLNEDTAHSDLEKYRQKIKTQ
jgi:glycerol-3-phosphate dehydrogenase